MAETEKEIAEQVTARKAELEEHQKNENIAEPEASATRRVDTNDIRRASAALAAGAQAAANGVQAGTENSGADQMVSGAERQSEQAAAGMRVTTGNENADLTAK